MDEGDDSKIRRNLVVFSTLIVFVAWLEIPVGQIAAGLLKLGVPPQINPFKLWLTCAAVLLYLTLRYRFTAEWTRLVATYKSNLGEAFKSVGAKRTQRSIATFIKTKKNDGGFKGQLVTFYDLRVAKQKQKYGDQIGEPEIRVADASGYTVNRAQVSINLVWEERLVGSAAPENKSMPYKFDWLEFKLIQMYAHIHTLVYSHSSVQYVVPLVLTTAAFAVIAWNLYHSL